MDLIDLLLQLGLVTTALVAYLLIFRRSKPIKFKGNYREPAWNYFLRYQRAKFAAERWKSSRPVSYPLEGPRVGQREGWDCVTIRASAPDGSAILLAIRKLYENPPLAETTVHIKLADGTCYQLPQHPGSLLGQWEGIESGWSAGGLKIETLEERLRLRVLYNGMLKRTSDGVEEHVRCNFSWTSASNIVRHPEDWSNKLAAQALALEPWRDSDWPNILGKWGDGSWLQFGAVQGRMQCYDEEGGVARSEYLRLRGVRERSWALAGFQGLRRSVSVVAAARDGTAVQLKGFSYKDYLTLGFTGCVRFPDYTVRSITGTDLVLADFCEQPGEVPNVFTINVSTAKRNLKLVLRANTDGCTVLSGVPYQLETHYRTAQVDIDGVAATGLLELGYQTNAKGPTVTLPAITLRWAKECETENEHYCVPFEAPAAACTGCVGGKGASLALLASVQKQMGYKVPPGYCLTTKALDKHLEDNPQLKSAISEIEAASENYDENNFKEKCNKASELFAKTEITGEVRHQILLQLNELRKKAIEQNLGPELRFAVRSSAVGEDSEALSAAGQNESVLGCSSDADVLSGVQRCWGSMFAFTSAHYRRSNGQRCLCGGGVVVQALVRARAAGVMFTAHPAAGHPRRLLLTASYGLGESVVSGSVEPDTIIVSRGKELAVSKIELGSKKQRITATGNSVTTEEVAEADRKLPCLTVTEALELARIGVAQEEAWGAGRDIEWAITKDGIYLLQARPITSLERWTEEELLHELDTAIMADDELLTFANTGEVFPKAGTAMSYDLVALPLMDGLNDLLHSENKFDRSLVITHLRASLALYSSLYRIVPSEINLTVKMMEMSIFGHTFMDKHILSVAQHRHPSSAVTNMLQILESIKYLFKTKSCMNNSIKLAKNLHINTDLEEPVALLESIADIVPAMQRCCCWHGVTSAGSTASQFLAMMILLEGASDFSTEQCNEMNALLSSGGGVLSAEVPQALARIAKLIQDSGQVEQFRAQQPKQAMDWLQQNIPKIYQEIDQFLKEHGHRAVMEFDLYTKPWALVPEEMLEVLQNIHTNEENKQAAKTDAEIIASLKTPKKASTKKILRWILPLCHRTVRHREGTKAHLVLIIHKMRLALLRLGSLMVKQWYLPDQDLVFHFRLQELRKYLINRDPVLLKKAIQRRQHLPSWCQLRFREMNTGWVQPVRRVARRVRAGAVTVRATPVCGGEAVARACVVTQLTEIGQLQRGDILITHSTDIGWSPYFPLLSGIVTELGGLISHGAVIAREYGLPCLVGAADATELFRTGDIVRLSADEGIVQKVSVEAEPDPNALATDKLQDEEFAKTTNGSGIL